jgi:hypothetical protein
MEWRINDESRAKIFGQAGWWTMWTIKVGLFYIFPLHLSVEGEPVITKLEKKRSSSRSK